MKTILIIITMMVGLSSYAQKDNALFVSFSAGDLGIGARYDRVIGYNGIYGSAALGNYKLIDGGYINNHVRLAIGGFMFLPERTNNYYHTKVTLGAVCHIYGEKDYSEGTINEEAFFPLSAEIGMTSLIKWFTAGLRLDIIKFEVAVDFGFNF